MLTLLAWARRPPRSLSRTSPVLSNLAVTKGATAINAAHANVASEAMYHNFVRQGKSTVQKYVPQSQCFVFDRCAHTTGESYRWHVGIQT